MDNCGSVTECPFGVFNCQEADNRRSVGFSSDVVERPLSGLHRRDTPHHLKNSRLRSEVNGQDTGAKLRQMIAQNPALVQPAVSVPPSQGSAPPEEALESMEESSSFEVVDVI